MIHAPRLIRLIMELRRHGVTDTGVLSAIERVPREVFIPEAMQDKAYEDVALPIGQGQTISQPVVVGRMTQALDVGQRMRILEVGTGSGYQTAILAQLARWVYTIERYKELMVEAQRRLEQLSLHNIVTRIGDGSRGWAEQAPFDRIIVTCAAASPPHALMDQLAVGGVMVMPFGANPLDQHVFRIVRTEIGWEEEDLFPVRFVPLITDD